MSYQKYISTKNSKLINNSVGGRRKRVDNSIAKILLY